EQDHRDVGEGRGYDAKPEQRQNQRDDEQHDRGNAAWYFLPRLLEETNKETLRPATASCAGGG
ncbi:MAG: hypothetical protein WBH90_04040, partial [Aggregatilineales bacterium]